MCHICVSLLLQIKTGNLFLKLAGNEKLGAFIHIYFFSPLFSIRDLSGEHVHFTHVIVKQCVTLCMKYLYIT